jgi:hypothetical protein
VLEEHGTDAAALVLVGHGEGDLGGMRLGPRVTSDPDDALGAVVAQRGDEAGAVDEVEPREAIELRVGEPALRPEEPEVDRTRAQSMEVLDQALAIVGPNGADVDRGAVAEDLLDRVLARVGDRAGVARTWSGVNPMRVASRRDRRRHSLGRCVGRH